MSAQDAKNFVDDVIFKDKNLVERLKSLATTDEIVDEIVKMAENHRVSITAEDVRESGNQTLVNQFKATDTDKIVVEARW